MCARSGLPHSLRQQLAYRALGLVDGEMRIGIPAGIGVRDGNAPLAVGIGARSPSGSNASLRPADGLIETTIWPPLDHVLDVGQRANVLPAQREVRAKLRRGDGDGPLTATTRGRLVRRRNIGHDRNLVPRAGTSARGPGAA
jgi:hypothetical protein